MDSAISRKTGRTLIAHRGVHGINSAVENSLDSLNLAIKFGVVAEIDVFFTSTGKIVLLHGLTVNNRMIDRSLRYLTEVWAKSKQLASVESALELVNGQIPLLLDFKHLGLATPQAIDRITHMLRGYSGTLMLASFHRDVWKLKRQLPEIPVGLMVFYLSSSRKKYENYDFLAVQKNIYEMQKRRFQIDKPTMLWTYSSLNRAVEDKGNELTTGICNIRHQEFDF